MKQRLNFTLLFIFALTQVGVAQHLNDQLLAKYPFLNMDQNRLQFFDDSTNFMKFYQKLDTLIFKGEGQINVVHMGGSHVQAGTLSDRMRQNWMTLSPGLRHNRGFFFPYKLAHTNNPSNYSVMYDGFWEGCRCALPSSTCSWGVSGINASTVDTNAEFTIVAHENESANYGFQAVRIFYLMNDSSFKILPAEEHKILDIRYDSVAQFVEFTFAEKYTSLHCILRQQDSSKTGFTLQGIQYMSNLPGLVYHSLGVNGAATYSFLRCENFANQMESLQPDLVIFGLGINDAYRPENQFSVETYESNYDSLIAEIKKVNPDCAFIFMTNNDSYYKRKYSNPNIKKVQIAMRSLAKKNSSAYWDLYEVMGGKNSIKVWETYNLAKRDKIHFTPTGYRLNSDLMFEAIKLNYGNYLQNQYKKAN